MTKWRRTTLCNGCHEPVIYDSITGICKCSEERHIPKDFSEWIQILE